MMQVLQHIRSGSFCLFISFLSLTPCYAAKNAWLEKKQNFQLIHLEGDRYEVWDSYAKLIKEQPELKKSFLSTQDLFDELMTPKTPFLFFYDWFKTNVFWSAISDFIPKSNLMAIEPFAKQLSITPFDSIKPMLLIDAFHWVVNFPLLYPYFPNKLKDYNRTKTFMVGKENQYTLHAGLQSFTKLENDKQPPITILQVVPENGNASVSLSQNGIMNLGFIGFNESGLSLSIQTISNFKSQREATPLFIILQSVLNDADTIQEALEIISPYRKTFEFDLYIAKGLERANIQARMKETKIYRLNTQEMSSVPLIQKFPTNEKTLNEFLISQLDIDSFGYILDPKSKSIKIVTKSNQLTINWDDLRSSEKPKFR